MQPLFGERARPEVIFGVSGGLGGVVGGGGVVDQTKESGEYEIDPIYARLE